MFDVSLHSQSELNRSFPENPDTPVKQSGPFPLANLTSHGGRTSAEAPQKHTFFALFLHFIWSCQKKAVILHPQNSENAIIVMTVDRLSSLFFAE